MRSEGFSFNFGGLGIEPCSRPVVSMFATVRNRNVAVTLGLACERVLFRGAGIAKLLGRAARCVCSDGCFRLTFGGSLARNARFADFDIEFLRKSRTKHSFWRLDVSLFEEVSYETLVLES